MTTVLGLLASGFFLLRLLPQPLRLARGGGSAGVSASSALNALVADVAWIAYGLWAGLPTVWVVSVAAGILSVWAAVLLRRDVRPGDVAFAALWIVALVLAARADLVDAALAAGVLVTQGPAVVKALREDDLRGIAPATWWISILDALTWGAYGVAVGSVALMGYAVVLLASSGIVLSRVYWTRRVLAPAATAA